MRCTVISSCLFFANVKLYIYGTPCDALMHIHMSNVQIRLKNIPSSQMLSFLCLGNCFIILNDISSVVVPGITKCTFAYQNLDHCRLKVLAWIKSNKNSTLFQHKFFPSHFCYECKCSVIYTLFHMFKYLKMTFKEATFYLGDSLEKIM